MAYLLLFIIFISNVYGDVIARQDITISIMASNILEIQGPNPNISIDLESYRQNVIEKVTVGNTYSYVTNDGTAKKIMASLDQKMPAHTQVSLYLSPPPAGQTLGWNVLSTEPVDLVRNVIHQDVIGFYNLRYKVTIYPDHPYQSVHFVRTVTYTLMEDY